MKNTIHNPLINFQAIKLNIKIKIAQKFNKPHNELLQRRKHIDNELKNKIAPPIKLKTHYPLDWEKDPNHFSRNA